MENKYMTEWKRNSIRIGAPTCILAAFTAFIPVLYLCSRYNCWPSLEVVLSAWALTALSFGAFYIVEPISYYAALGISPVNFLLCIHIPHFLPFSISNNLA